MTKAELITKIEALNEWEELMEQAKAEAEAIRDSIKEEMTQRDTEELIAGSYIIRWRQSPRRARVQISIDIKKETIFR